MIDVANVERHLVARGYRVVHETGSEVGKVRGYQRESELPVYLNRKSRTGVSVLIAHPFSLAPKLRGLIPGLTVPEKYFHHSHMHRFPKRRNTGKDEVGYGWSLTFATEDALERLLDALSGPPETDSPVPDFSALEAVLPEEELPGTEGRDAQGMATYRLGQSFFRQKLVDYWGTCAVTGLVPPLLLRASHIKPWALSLPGEKTDPFNGLLLAPNLDAAFDAGYITFNEDGCLRRSTALSAADAEMLGLSGDLRLRKVDSRHGPYLEFHRTEVFLKVVA